METGKCGQRGTKTYNHPAALGVRWQLGEQVLVLFQVKLKQITPRTEEEKTEHSVAAERRRMRLVYADTIKDLLANSAFQYGEWLWVGRAAGGPLCPEPHWEEGGESFPWDVYPLAASGLAGLLASRPPSGKGECLLPSCSSQRKTLC